MQKVCRYPLLFAELYRHTPAVDDPASSAEIGNILSKLLEMAGQINKATNDRETQLKIRRSSHLHNMLILPDTVSLEESQYGMMLKMCRFRLQRLFRCAYLAMPRFVARSLWHTNQPMISLEITCSVRCSDHIYFSQCLRRVSQNLRLSLSQISAACRWIG